MLLTRWTPDFTSEWNRLHHEMNRLFQTLDTARPQGPTLAYSYPPLNVWEDEERVYAEAELPGMGRDDLEIFVTGGNQLTVQGQRKPCVDAQGVWHRRERGFGKFSRTVTLPSDVDADKVEAGFENGVLLLTMPKAERSRPRRITVKAD